MEKMNRKIFYFNAFLDHVFLRPFARGYDAVLSDSTKQHVGNFVENIVVTPVTTVNYALQADFGNVLNSFWKFVINSTFGIFGTYDVAGMSGLNPRAQTFGSTLAHYGVPSGKYVVLPILGSTNTRDMLDSFLNSAMNPAKSHLTKKQNLSILVLDKLHQRYKILPFTDYISRTAIDPYTSIKSAYHQSREKEVVYPAGYKCGRQNYKQVLELK
jgi:phospholipid-binding lipoprotein MlaA